MKTHSFDGRFPQAMGVTLNIAQKVLRSLYEASRQPKGLFVVLQQRPPHADTAEAEPAVAVPAVIGLQMPRASQPTLVGLGGSGVQVLHSKQAHTLVFHPELQSDFGDGGLLELPEDAQPQRVAREARLSEQLHGAPVRCIQANMLLNLIVAAEFRLDFINLVVLPSPRRIRDCEYDTDTAMLVGLGCISAGTRRRGIAAYPLGNGKAHSFAPDTSLTQVLDGFFCPQAAPSRELVL